MLVTTASQMAVQLVTAQTASQINAHDRELAQRILSQVHETLKHNYYDPSFHGVDIDARLSKYSAEIKSANTFQAAYRTIESFLIGLDDSHTIFIPPPNSNRVTYGFRIKMNGDQCFVTGLRPNSDAAQKLRLGDQVLSLDGYTVNREDIWQIEYYLKFLPRRLATDFTLRDNSGGVRKESVNAELEALPARRPASPSLSRMHLETWQHNIRSRSAEQDDVFFWKFASFNEEEGGIEHMLGEARKHRALVLDLRDNSGGSQNNLVFVLGSLFNHDVTVGRAVTREETKPLAAKSRGRSAFTGQLVVLVDGRSASASEILARVVQIEKRGVVIGDRSAGSVMAARFFPLSVGMGNGFDYGVQVTVADLIMGDGKSLEHVGITPDEILLPSADDLATGRDPLLARAAALVGAKLDATSAGKLFPVEWPSAEPLR
jgi:C-terminal processing protease CtpA/Prc